MGDWNRIINVLPIEYSQFKKKQLHSWRKGFRFNMYFVHGVLKRSQMSGNESKLNLFIVAGYFTLILHNAFLYFISLCIIMNMKMIKKPTNIAILFIYLNILREKLHYLKI